MKVSCPSCQAAFIVKPEQLGPKGRRLKCGRCGEQWHQKPVTFADQPEDHARKTAAEPLRSESAVAAPGGPRPKPAVATPAKKSGGSWLAVGWLLLLVLVGGLAGGLWYWRDIVVAEVPELATLYEMVGMERPLPGDGLEMRDITHDSRLVGDDRELIISGKVVNVSRGTVAVPGLRASLHDAQGKELRVWEFAAESLSLEKGEEAKFTTSTLNPPREGSNLSISFVVSQ